MVTVASKGPPGWDFLKMSLLGAKAAINKLGRKMRKEGKGGTKILHFHLNRDLTYQNSRKEVCK